jgi:SNF2 family DNA or RNA helicase
VSLARQDRRRLLEVADELGLEVDHSLLQFELSEAARRAQAAGLYPFQVEGVDWLAGRPRALLADEMGLGKTPQALLALPPEVPALVVCPASLKYQWREQARRWRPVWSVTVLEGRKSFRLPEPGEIVVANYEILPAALDRRTKVMMDPEWDSVGEVYLIVDEAHMVKNRRARRTKRVAALARLVHSAWGLTGTPLLSHPPDLYGVLECLGLAREAFGSWQRYQGLFHATPNYWGGLIWGPPSPEVPQRLRRVMLRRLRAEVLPQLPAKRYERLVVGLDRALGGRLDTLWDEWEQVRPGREDLPPFERFSEVRAQLATSRIPIMHELGGQFEEEGVPLVVFSAHLAPIQALEGRDGWATITGATPPRERQAAVAAFQGGRLKGLGLTIQAGGTGLTLTRAHTALFVDLDWTPANNLQAEDRLCRIGQEADRVRVIRLVGDHPLDRHVLKVLDRKAELIRGAVEGRRGDGRTA